MKRTRSIALLIAAVLASACGARVDPGSDVVHMTDAVDVTTDVEADAPVHNVDLLMMVDNSNSMRGNQANVMFQLSAMMNALVSPPCVSTTNPTPHLCTSTPGEHLLYAPISSLNVGVIDSDLGTPNSNVAGCANSMLGDDGLLNPIRDGAALAQHEPWVSVPATYPRPIDCSDPNEYPTFIHFDSSMVATNQEYQPQFVHDFQCNASLYVNGCDLESQLEAVWRALIDHDARAASGSNPNAGFLRDDALLAIVVLSDEEDGSVRNCDYAGPDACTDNNAALDVYNASSTRWSNPDLNLRFYMYQPGGPQDPTWNLNRYIDPADPTHGFLGLKPGHPERVLFAAITGVPLSAGIVGAGRSAEADWDALLGTPGPNGPDDFNGRNAGPGSAAINMMSAEGPVSMYQANLDAPNCLQRTVPACRRQGSTYTAGACTADVQYFAWPARRIVEVARRFDIAPVCNGAPCHNGVATSICSTDYVPAMRLILQRAEPGFGG